MEPSKILIYSLFQLKLDLPVYLISASLSVCRDRHRHSSLDVAEQVEDHKRMSKKQMIKRQII